MEDRSDEVRTAAHEEVKTADSDPAATAARRIGRRMRVRTAAIAVIASAGVASLIAVGGTTIALKNHSSSTTSDGARPTPAAGSPSNASGGEPKPLNDIDLGAWRDELRRAGAKSNPDMKTFYAHAVKDCAATTDQLSQNFSQDDGHPDWVRIGMSNVCPSRVSKVDEALTALQARNAEFEQACSTPPNLRTQAQQELVAAGDLDCCSGPRKSR